MKYPINYNSIKPNLKYYTEVIQLYEEASAYLLSFRWCKQLKNAQLYLSLGSKLCIFLFEIENSASADDNYLWIIVGDLPPMYLDIHGPKTTKQVLEDYIGLAEDWIENVKLGKPVDDCYPFKAEPNLEMAALLERRASFMKNTLIDNIDDLPISINK